MANKKGTKVLGPGAKAAPEPKAQDTTSPPPPPPSSHDEGSDDEE